MVYDKTNSSFSSFLRFWVSKFWFRYVFVCLFLIYRNRDVTWGEGPTKMIINKCDSKQSICGYYNKKQSYVYMPKSKSQCKIKTLKSDFIEMLTNKGQKCIAIYKNNFIFVDI